MQEIPPRKRNLFSNKLKKIDPRQSQNMDPDTAIRIFENEQAKLYQVLEQREQEARLSSRTLKGIQNEIWQYKLNGLDSQNDQDIQEFEQTEIQIDPFKAEDLRNLQKISIINNETIEKLKKEQYQQSVNREKMGKIIVNYMKQVVLQRYKEQGVGVQDVYNRYLQSENYRGMKDLPLSYKRLLGELEAAVERKKALKRLIEQEKAATELALSDLRRKHEEAVSINHSLQKEKEQYK